MVSLSATRAPQSQQNPGPAFEHPALAILGAPKMATLVGFQQGNLTRTDLKFMALDKCVRTAWKE